VIVVSFCENGQANNLKKREFLGDTNGVICGKAIYDQNLIHYTFKARQTTWQVLHFIAGQDNRGEFHCLKQPYNCQPSRLIFWFGVFSNNTRSEDPSMGDRPQTDTYPKHKSSELRPDSNH
jgi:hypothetical protein